MATRASEWETHVLFKQCVRLILVAKRCLLRQLWKQPNILFLAFRRLYTVMQWLGFDDFFFFSSLFSHSSPRGSYFSFKNQMYLVNLYSFYCYLFVFNAFWNWFWFSILSLKIWFHLIFSINFDLHSFNCYFLFIIFLIYFIFQLYPLFLFNFYTEFNLYYFDCYFFLILSMIDFLRKSFMPWYLDDWKFCFLVFFSLFFIG